MLRELEQSFIGVAKCLGHRSSRSTEIRVVDKRFEGNSERGPQGNRKSVQDVRLSF